MLKHDHIVILVIILLFISCRNNTNKKQDTPTSGITTIAVDETFEPIIRNEINVFESIYITAGIIEKACPEIDAFNLLLKDSVNMIIATRKLHDNENKYFKSKQIFPKEIKIAVDGIALIVNNHNPDSLITVSQIRQILSGEVTSWKEIFPSSKLGQFQVVFDNSNSSTIRYAIDSICNGKPLSKKLYAQNNNPEVIDFVSKTPNSIGVIGVNWLGNHRKDTTNLSFKSEVRVMSVSNEVKATAANSYKPFQAYLFYGYYPLTRTIFIILNDPRGSLPSGLTSFLTSDRGQRIILKSGILPATQPVRVVHIKD